MQPVASPTAKAPIPADARAVLTINLAALRANWATINRNSGTAECAGVIKADAYGLGLEEIATALRNEGCKTLVIRREVIAVSTRRIDHDMAELIERRLQRALVDTAGSAEHSPTHHPPSTTILISVISFTEYAGPSRVLPLSRNPPYGCWSARHVGTSLTSTPP